MIYGNKVTVMFVSQGSLSFQHTGSVTIHSRHLSSNDRIRIGESKLNHSLATFIIGNLIFQITLRVVRMVT